MHKNGFCFAQLSILTTTLWFRRQFRYKSTFVLLVVEYVLRGFFHLFLLLRVFCRELSYRFSASFDD